MFKSINKSKAVVIAALLPFLYFADASHDAPVGLTLMREAHAVVGVPVSPVSVAGVARRTTRRTVAVTSTAATPAAQPAPVAQPAAAPRPAGAPAAGTVVYALPAGCAPETIGGVEYQRCGGVSYRSAFQGNNLVYVAQ